MLEKFVKKPESDYNLISDNDIKYDDILHKKFITTKISKNGDYFDVWISFESVMAASCRRDTRCSSCKVSGLVSDGTARWIIMVNTKFEILERKAYELLYNDNVLSYDNILTNEELASHLIKNNKVKTYVLEPIFK